MAHRLLLALLYNLYCAVICVLALILIPLLLPLSFMFRIYRKVIVTRIKSKLGKDVMMASGQDGVWLQDTPTNRAIINTLLSIKGEPDIGVYQKIMKERMVERESPYAKGELLFPKLSMHTAKILHRFVWLKDEDFDIKDHVHEYQGDPPHNKEELQDEVGKICSRDLPADKSPWEMIIMPPMVGSDEFIVVFRVHHSIGDGISLVKCFVNCAADHPPEEPKSHRFGAQGMAWRIAKSVLQGPVCVLHRMLSPTDRNILHGVPLTGHKKVAWSEQIDLDLIKRMKNSTGTTVNDVLLSCFAGAVGDYMRQNTPSGGRVPDNISSVIPVDIRQSKKLELDNQFGVVYVNLPIGEKDPLALLRKTKRGMDDMKASPEPLVNNVLISFMMARVPSFLSEFLLNWITNKATLILSNVPGPTQMLTMNGQNMDDVVFWPPQRKEVGMGISILSYNNHLRIGVMTDKAIMTNPSSLVQLFVARVHSLASMLKEE